MNIVKEVGFSIQRIVTEQFAILGENTEGNIELLSKLAFNIDVGEHILGVLAHFIFEQDEKPALIIQTAIHFEIDKKSWDAFHDKEASTITFPIGFLTHLSVLTVGTTRGVLHAKTENTIFNKWVLPTINVAEMIEKDVSFDLLEQDKS